MHLLSSSGRAAAVKIFLALFCGCLFLAAGRANAADWSKNLGAQVSEEFGSAPMYVDLDADGDTEVLRVDGANLYAYNGSDGTNFSNYPVNFAPFVAVGIDLFEEEENLTGRKGLIDADGDGSKELLLFLIDALSSATLRAINPATGATKWDGPGGIDMATIMTGLVADIDGDGAQELVLSRGSSVGENSYINRTVVWYHLGGDHVTLQQTLILGTGPALNLYALGGGTLAVVSSGTVTFYNGVTGDVIASIAPSPEWGSAAFVRPFSRKNNDSGTIPVLDIDSDGQGEFAVKFSSSIPTGSSYTYKTAVQMFNSATYAWEWSSDTMTALSASAAQENDTGSTAVRVFVGPFLSSSQHGFFISSYTLLTSNTMSVVNGQTKAEAWRETNSGYPDFDIVDFNSDGTAEIVAYRNGDATVYNGADGALVWILNPNAQEPPLNIEGLANLVRADQARWVPANTYTGGGRDLSVLTSSGSYGTNQEFMVQHYDTLTHAELGRSYFGQIGTSGADSDEIEGSATNLDGDPELEFAIYLGEDRDSGTNLYAGQRFLAFDPFIPQSFACAALSTSSIRYTWADLTGETGYQVLGLPFNVLQSVGANVVTADETGLVNQVYTRGLRATTSFGYGQTNQKGCTTQPSGPTGFVGVPQSSTSISWQWTDTAGNEMSYRMYTSTGGLLAIIADNSASWVETGLTPNAFYTRYAQAYNDFSSSNSAPGSAYAKSAAPVNLVLTALSSTTLKADWGTNNNAAATDYEVSVSSAADFDVAFTTVSLASNATTYQMDWLAGGVVHYVVVRAQNLGDIGYSAYSSTVSKVMPAQPSVPGSFGAAAIASTTIQWGWTPSTYVDGYKLYSSGDVLLSSTTGLSVSETGLTPNTQYTRYVQGYNDLFTNNSVSSAVYTTAAVPLSLTLTALSSTTLKADWLTNGNPAATDYEVSVSSDISFDVTFTTATLAADATTYQAGGLIGAVTYYVKVRAKNEGAAGYSAYTSSVSKVMPAQPSAPGSFGAAAIASTTIQWGWTPSTYTDGYKLYSSTNGLLSVGPGLSASEAGLTPNTAYTRYVQAYNDVYTQNSVSSTAYTTAAVPLSLTLTALSSTTLKADWLTNGNPAATDYEVSVSSDISFDVAFTTAALAADATTYQAGSLIGAVTYYVRVRAKNEGAAGYSAYTSTVSKVMPAQPSVPGSFVPAVIGSATIQWSWTASTYADGYKLYSSTDGLLSTTAGLSASEAGLTPNTAYTRYVQSYNAVYSQNSLSSATYTLAALPGVPALTVASRNSLSASWVANNNPAGTNYRIQYSTDSGFADSVSTAAVVASTFTQLASLNLGTTYYARVLAINSQAAATAYTSTSSVVTWALPVIAGVTPSSGTVISTGVVVALTGNNFHTGDTAYLLLGATTAQATVTSITGLTSATAQFSLIGLCTATWDVILKDAAGNASAATGLTDFAVLSESGVEVSTVSAAIATITSPNSVATLVIPANTLAGGVVYVSTDPVSDPIAEDPAKITLANASLPAGQALVPGVLTELVAFDNTGAQVTIPVNPVRIYINYPDVDDDGIVDGTIIREANLFVVWMNPATSRWEAMPGTVLDAANHRVYVDSTHLSVFSIAAVTTMADLSTAKVYPNPWKPGSGGSHDRAAIKFDNLADNTSIRIYNVAGELVKDLPESSLGYIEWDGKASGGGKASSGVYFAHIKAGSGTKILKFAIER